MTVQDVRVAPAWIARARFLVYVAGIAVALALGIAALRLGAGPAPAPTADSVPPAREPANPAETR